MAKICCVDGCSTAIEGIFFKFPNSRTLRRKWMDVITTSKKLPDDSLVCSQHFLDDQYEIIRGKNRLKAKVVPSLFVRAKSKSPEKINSTKKTATANNITADSKSDGINSLVSIDNINNVPDTLTPDNKTTDDLSDTLNNKNNLSGTINNLPKKSPELENQEHIKENGDISKDTQSAQELFDIENKDIEDIITNYHIKQTIPNRIHSPERDVLVTDVDCQSETRRHGDKDVIEINDDHAEPQFIEISADKGQSRDCLMVLENVQVEVDPNLMFPDFEEVEEVEDENSNDSDVIDLGEKKEDPISLLTSSDEDEVIIEEPKIDTVEVSDETDEDDVPLVKLVKTVNHKKSRSKSKSRSHFGLEQVMWGAYEYYCVECHYTTHSSAEFKEHKRTHSTIFEVCQVCSFTTASKSQFIRHKRKHKFEKRYQCHVCEYKARHHMSLIYHMKTHNSENDKCKKCGYISSVRIDYIKHVKQCCVKKCYKCDQCKYQTLRRTDLKRHRLRVHHDCDDELDTDYTPG